MKKYVAISVAVLVSLPLTAAAVSSWAYQLQGYDRGVLSSISVDLLVVDADELAKNRIPVERLQVRNDRVVSYLSVGEAESYRSYWKPEWNQNPPAWLGDENPNWRNNYRVRYWDAAWQELMVKAVLRIALDGYDGIYLDRVDTYRHYDEMGHANAHRAMIQLVTRLAAAGRHVNPNFVVVAQNAAELTDDSTYTDTIDGLASEDTFYDGDRRITASDAAPTVRHLQRARSAGKFVLSVDYPKGFGAVLDYCSRARAEEFVPLVAPRALNALITDPNYSCSDGPTPAIATR